MHQPTTPDFSELIPELSQWNDGKGIDPEVWIGNVGNCALAIGYSLIFWPKFVAFDGYILRVDIAGRIFIGVAASFREEC